MNQETKTQNGKIFSFAEIVKERNSSVRVTDDGLLYAVDLVMIMTGLARTQAGLTLHSLSEKEFQSFEISLIDRPAVSGGRPIKLITFEHAIKLVMVLPPAETDKEIRIAFANIIRRYLAGDNSLINEVGQNANSCETISQMFTELQDSITSSNEKRIFNKRVLEQDDTLTQLIIQKQKITMQEVELIEKNAISVMKSLDVQKTIIDTYTSLCENKVLDDSAKLLFKENILKIAYHSVLDHSVLVGWDNTTDSMNACAS